MAWSPKYRLYANDGLTLVYTFTVIPPDNSPQDPIRFTEISGPRGIGSIIVPGSESSWELKLHFLLQSTNYEGLITLIDGVESTIVPNAEYVLKIDRSISTTKNYNVKRIMPVEWDDSRRIRIQKGTITFLVNSW
jgi:hypothetical protein